MGLPTGVAFALATLCALATEVGVAYALHRLYVLVKFWRFALVHIDEYDFNQPSRFAALREVERLKEDFAASIKDDAIARELSRAHRWPRALYRRLTRKNKASS